MIMRGRAISPGYAEGEAITYPEAFSFLGGVDGKTGKFNVRDGTIDGKVFLFPNGKGSTVGSYVVYDLKVQGHCPAALVNRSAEATARSKLVPSFRMSAGERFTVTCLGGSVKPVFFSAVRTRSFASRTSAPRKPTMDISGRPEDASHSTRIRTPSIPKRAIALILLYMFSFPCNESFPFCARKKGDDSPSDPETS